MGIRRASEIESLKKVPSDLSHYVKLYKRSFFALEDLTTCERRCMFMVLFYLNKNSEFFYMSIGAMNRLLEAHFGKGYHEKNISLAFRKLHDRGFFREVGDGLFIINHNFAFVGDRLSVLHRHYTYDLFGDRDPMHRNNVNQDIEFNKSVGSYMVEHEFRNKQVRDYCLGQLRKKSRIKTLK
jgi:hypothetical protein